MALGVGGTSIFQLGFTAKFFVGVAAAKGPTCHAKAKQTHLFGVDTHAGLASLPHLASAFRNKAQNTCRISLSPKLSNLPPQPKALTRPTNQIFPSTSKTTLPPVVHEKEASKTGLHQFCLSPQPCFGPNGRHQRQASQEEEPEQNTW